jgi:hypothetical protein
MIERWHRSGPGWRLSLYAGWQRLAVGYWYDGYPSEWTLTLYLGSVSVEWWRRR